MCKGRLLRVGYRLCCSITCNVDKNEDGYTILTTQIRMSCLHAFVDFAESALICTPQAHMLYINITYVGDENWILVVVQWALVAVR